MRSFKKKMDSLDQLPARAAVRIAASASASGQTPHELTETGRERLEELRKRLVRANDRDEVEALLEQVQSEFGNQVAERMVKELRLDEDEPEDM